MEDATNGAGPGRIPKKGDGELKGLRPGTEGWYPITPLRIFKMAPNLKRQ